MSLELAPKVGRLTDCVRAIEFELRKLQEDTDLGVGGVSSLLDRSLGFRRSENANEVAGGSKLVRHSKKPLPDPRLIRELIKAREMRKQYFRGDLFADPAWDMILDLTAARAEFRRVSVTSLCIASKVPPTTALRWISEMVESGILVREEDPSDKRRAFISLSDRASGAVSEYFDACLSTSVPPL